jgi:hypothetical protein
MTNDLPDALIDKIKEQLPSRMWFDPSDPTAAKWATDIAISIAKALDISGIISDLRFYEDKENYKIGNFLPDVGRVPTVADDQGQRARTRLEKMGITNNGESK